MEAVTKILAEENCTLDELAYVGDDIIDLPVMTKSRLCHRKPQTPDRKSKPLPTSQRLSLAGKAQGAMLSTLSSRLA